MNDLVTQYDVTAGAASAVDIRASGTKNPEPWFYRLMSGGNLTSSGVSVTPNNSLTHPCIWQAVNILAGDVAQIPVRKFHRRQLNETQFEVEIDRGSRLDRMVRERPNQMQTIAQWKELVMRDALLWGNHCSLIRRDEVGSPILLPLSPATTHYRQVGQWDYVITTRINNEERVFEYADVVHIPNLVGEWTDNNGFWGTSIAWICRQAIGYALALLQHGASFFGNGALPSGVLEHPGILTADAIKNLREDWSNVHQGSENAGKIAVLWEGMKYNAIGMSNEDAQFIETQKLLREYIASMFGLPAYKLNSMENSSVRANLEEQSKEYYNTSLSRWTNKIAQELDRKMLTDAQRSSLRHYFKFLPEAFLAGDAKSRADVYAMGIRDRWMSPNEVRQREDLNPYPGGDEFGNPAIDTMDSQSAAADEETETDEQEDSEQIQAIEVLFVERISNMMQAEAVRIRNGAKRAPNFLDWVDDFFDGFIEFASPFVLTSCRVADAANISVDIDKALRSYAVGRRGELVTVAGEIDREGLVDRIHDFTNESIADRDKRAVALYKLSRGYHARQ